MEFETAYTDIWVSVNAQYRVWIIKNGDVFEVETETNPICGHYLGEFNSFEDAKKFVETKIPFTVSLGTLIASA